MRSLLSVLCILVGVLVLLNPITATSYEEESAALRAEGAARQEALEQALKDTPNRIAKLQAELQRNREKRAVLLARLEALEKQSRPQVAELDEADTDSVHAVEPVDNSIQQDKVIGSRPPLHVNVHVNVLTSEHEGQEEEEVSSIARPQSPTSLVNHENAITHDVAAESELDEATSSSLPSPPVIYLDYQNHKVRHSELLVYIEPQDSSNTCNLVCRHSSTLATLHIPVIYKSESTYTVLTSPLACSKVSPPTNADLIRILGLPKAQYYYRAQTRSDSKKFGLELFTSSKCDSNPPNSYYYIPSSFYRSPCDVTTVQSQKFYVSVYLPEISKDQTSGQVTVKRTGNC